MEVEFPFGKKKLLYGTMGYFAYIQEATGIDAYTFFESVDKKMKPGSTNQEKTDLIINDSVAFIYAGVNTYLDSIMVEDNEPLEVVKRWARTLSAEKVIEIIVTAINAMASDEVGGEIGQEKKKKKTEKAPA